MIRHDDTLLWGLARHSLEPDEKKYAHHHLADCPDCAERFNDFEAATQLLTQANRRLPRVNWSSVDERVTALMAQRSQRWLTSAWSGALTGAVAMAVLLAAAMALWSTPQPAPSPTAALPETPRELVRVVAATKLSSSRLGALLAGQTADTGDQIESLRAGGGQLLLPDQSQLTLGDETRLKLIRAEEKAVLLELERGRIAVRASHQPRVSFSISARGTVVHVVGTVFGVAASSDGVEVSVAEGKVLVEPAAGKTVMLEAGQRLWVSERFGNRRSVLSGQQKKSLEALSPPPLVAASGGLQPRRPAAKPLASTEDDWLPLPNPAPQPEPLPATPVAALAPAPEPPLSNDLESIFLTRAERSLERGTCERYLLGLEEIAADAADRSVRAERARMLRARCYDARLQPERAEAEYRRYLRDFPEGQFAAEAQRALSEVE